MNGPPPTPAATCRLASRPMPLVHVCGVRPRQGPVGSRRAVAPCLQECLRPDLDPDRPGSRQPARRHRRRGNGVHNSRPRPPAGRFMLLRPRLSRHPGLPAVRGLRSRSRRSARSCGSRSTPARCRRTTISAGSRTSSSTWRSTGPKRFPKQAIVNYLEKIGDASSAPTSTRTRRSTRPSTSSRCRPTTRSSSTRARHPARLGRRRHVRSGRGRQGARRRARGVAARPRRRSRACSTSSRRCCSPGSRYAERLPIGMPEILKKAPRDTLVALLQGLVPPRPDGGDRRR